MPSSSAASSRPNKEGKTASIKTPLKTANAPNSASSGNSASQKKLNYNCFGPYKLGKTIGQGEFGKVKLGYHLQSGNEVAIKLIKKESISQPSRKQKLVREIEILQSVNHRHIVKLWEVIETDNYIGMIMNYAEGGELFDHILTRRYLRDSEASRLFSQLILGVSYLHAYGIVHRDLKLENLLLDGARNLIITDFGFANRFRRGVGGKGAAADTEMLSTSCGSACYAAPELVINDKYSAEGADIWSCGVILYAMVCGYLPYDDDPTNHQGENINQLYKYIMETKLTFPAQVSLQAQHLILRILVTDPEKRAKMTEIQSHRWLSAFKNDFVAQQEGLPRVHGIESKLTPLGQANPKNTSVKTTEKITSKNSSRPKKASNPLLISIQEESSSVNSDTLKSGRSTTTHIDELSPRSVSHGPRVFSAGDVSAGGQSSSGWGEKPVTGKEMYAAPPALDIPRVPSPVPDVMENAPKSVVLGFRKSIDAAGEGQIQEDGVGVGEVQLLENNRGAASMDQSRAGIVGITDGLDEEFKKLKAVSKTGASMSKTETSQAASSTTTSKAAAASHTSDMRKQNAQDYHLLKFHSGPIDRRALTTKSPTSLQRRLIEHLQALGFELFFDPYDQFKMKAVQVKGIDGEPLLGSGKQTSMVSGFLERIKYVGQFGIHYNRGFTGSSPTPTSQQQQSRKKASVEPIKMYVMIHRIKNLDGLLTVDVKRRQGDIWEFKRMYEELIVRLKLSMS